jgi:hypothetical protein
MLLLELQNVILFYSFLLSRSHNASFRSEFLMHFHCYNATTKVLNLSKLLYNRQLARFRP